MSSEVALMLKCILHCLLSPELLVLGLSHQSAIFPFTVKPRMPSNPLKKLINRGSHSRVGYVPATSNEKFPPIWCPYYVCSPVSSQANRRDYPSRPTELWRESTETTPILVSPFLLHRMMLRNTDASVVQLLVEGKEIGLDGWLTVMRVRFIQYVQGLNLQAAQMFSENVFAMKHVSNAMIVGILANSNSPRNGTVLQQLRAMRAWCYMNQHISLGEGFVQEDVSLIKALQQ